MAPIPDLNDNELWVINDTLKQCYREVIEPDLAEVEMRVNPTLQNSQPAQPCSVSTIRRALLLSKPTKNVNVPSSSIVSTGNTALGSKSIEI